jgi:hypothetical protein
MRANAHRRVSYSRRFQGLLRPPSKTAEVNCTDATCGRFSSHPPWVRARHCPLDHLWKGRELRCVGERHRMPSAKVALPAQQLPLPSAPEPFVSSGGLADQGTDADTPGIGPGPSHCSWGIESATSELEAGRPLQSASVLTSERVYDAGGSFVSQALPFLHTSSGFPPT